MTGRGSLRLRLLAAGLLAVVVALAGAGVALSAMFERHLERRAVREAETNLRVLIAGAAIQNDKLALTAQPPDPRFEEAYSGLYWQVQTVDGVIARSRSLWDVELAPPRDELAAGGVHTHAIKGPRGAGLLAVERMVILTTPTGERAARFIVAQDRAELRQARDEFAHDIVFGLGLLALALLAASFVQVGVGLKPLDEVRARLQAIRSDARRRLPTAFPREVQPLAAEINALLDERDEAIARARGRAADLAHGLKTPLTAVGAHMRTLRARGERATADEVDALSAMMQRHVQRELARARAVGARQGSAVDQAPARLVAMEISAAVARAPAAEGKTFDLDIDEAASLPIDRADLEEMLGNLVENAARYARETVTIRVRTAPPSLEVSDDGPGLDDDDARRLVARGAQLDQAGSAGLGLAIVADLAEVYGAALSFGRAPQGGLRAHVAFRAA